MKIEANVFTEDMIVPGARVYYIGASNDARMRHILDIEDGFVRYRVHYIESVTDDYVDVMSVAGFIAQMNKTYKFTKVELPDNAFAITADMVVPGATFIRYFDNGKCVIREITEIADTGTYPVKYRNTLVNGDEMNDACHMEGLISILNEDTEWREE